MGRINDLSSVLASWEASASLHDPNAPATEEELRRAEEQLGRSFPPDLAALYGQANGGAFLDGNLVLEPLDRRARFQGVTTLTHDLRRTGIALPPELLVFGSDGSDGLFGAWVPAATTPTTTPVIEIAEGGEGFALVGTSLPNFLRARTAYYLLLLEATPNALDALGLPQELRGDPDDIEMSRFLNWADPDLPDHRADPYDRPTPLNELRRVYGSDA